MKIQINGDLTPALREHVTARLDAALNQHQRRVDHVEVKLGDVNGAHHGGSDQQCQVRVRLRPRGMMLIKEIGTDMYAAVSRAADRVKSAVGRQLARRKDHHGSLRRMAFRGRSLDPFGALGG